MGYIHGVTYPATPFTHTVVKTDTLYWLAIDNHTTEAQILKDNPQIKDPHWIYPGQKLLIRTPAEAAKAAYTPPKPSPPPPSSPPKPVTPPVTSSPIPTAPTPTTGQTIDLYIPPDGTGQLPPPIDPSAFTPTDLYALNGQDTGNIVVVGYNASTDYDDVIPNMMTNGVHAEKEYNEFEQLDKYQVPGPKDFYESGYAFVFFTTPSINVGIGKDVPMPNGKSMNYAKYNINADSFFMELDNNEPHILASLTTDLPNMSPIVRLLTNRFRGFDPEDTTMKTAIVKEDLVGFKQLLPQSYVDSTVAGSFNVSYIEDSDLSVTKTHKAWLTYMEHVRRGKMFASFDAIQSGYLDYMSSMYYFTLKPDGMTISYFAKYTGVVPTGIPYSSFSHKIGDHGLVELSIPYIFNYKEDLNPDIIADFNNSVGKGGDVQIMKRKPFSGSGYGKPTYDYILAFNDDPFVKLS
jgi:LysM repeat protein